MTGTKILNFTKKFSDNPKQAAQAIISKIEAYGLKENKEEIKKTIPKDAILITYGDQISDSSKQLSPLQTQKKWLNENSDDAIKVIHILPFYPFSSDDGFSVIDYKAVHSDFGSWDDINDFSANYTLMFDAVVNHCSQEHQWFKDYLAGKDYCQDYFIEVAPDNPALKKVVRPRTLPLVHSYKGKSGIKNIWTTFSEDQIDLNFANPQLLAEIIDILFFYIKNGARYIRLDAITFAIKKLGTNCASLEETHQLVQLIRFLLSRYAPNVVLITETNVPHKENISYFGQGNEAQIVYNFPLPPLLIHAVLRQDVRHLTAWAQGLESDIPDNCAYFNITATHDGIGMRGAMAELGTEEIGYLGRECQNRGGQILERTNDKGKRETYELNITFFDMLTPKGASIDAKAIRRFMLTQYFVFAFKGVPGIYFHNLFASSSWQKGYEQTQIPRTLNRQKFTDAELNILLKTDKKSEIIFKQQKAALKLYQKISAFGPHGQQKVTQIDPSLIQIIRTDENNNEVIAYFNFSDNEKSISLNNHYKDLLTNKNLTETVLIPSWDVLWLIEQGA